MRATTAPLLVVEDDPNDMFMFTRLLKSSGVTNPLQVALNGEEAIELLERITGRGEMLTIPAAAFIDTRMPGRNGLQVLEWIRSRTALDRVAVIMLSHSQDSPAVVAAAAMGAQCYLRKYPSTATVTQVMQEAGEFTFGVQRRVFDMPNNLLKLAERGRPGDR